MTTLGEPDNYAQCVLRRMSSQLCQVRDIRGGFSGYGDSVIIEISHWGPAFVWAIATTKHVVLAVVVVFITVAPLFAFYLVYRWWRDLGDTPLTFTNYVRALAGSAWYRENHNTHVAQALETAVLLRRTALARTASTFCRVFGNCLDYYTYHGIDPNFAAAAVDPLPFPKWRPNGGGMLPNYYVRYKRYRGVILKKINEIGQSNTDLVESEAMLVAEIISALAREFPAGSDKWMDAPNFDVRLETAIGQAFSDTAQRVQAVRVVVN